MEAERYMRRQPSELAMVIAENNDQTKEIVKIGYEMLQGVAEPTDLELWSAAYAGMKDFCLLRRSFTSLISQTKMGLTFSKLLTLARSSFAIC